MFKWLANFGDSNEREIKKLDPIVKKINEFEPEFEKLSDAELMTKTAEFKKRIAEATAELNNELAQVKTDLATAQKCQLEAVFDDKEELSKQCKDLQSKSEAFEKNLKKLENEVLDKLLPEAFAAVREAAKRTIHQRHFDVQLIGGMVLHHGRIAEMRTGEGKTLVATLPLYLNSLTGRGAHLVTVNDYLARRDPYWMGPIFNALGVSVASIYPMQTPDEHMPARLYDKSYDTGMEEDPWRHFKPIPRKEAYLADITYGTSAEFGFDYLRDNMAVDLSQCSQRDLYFAIVDEADNLLIDEARTPLIISAPDTESSQRYQVFARLVQSLKPVEDYEIKEKEHSVEPTDEGFARVEQLLKREGLLKGDSLYDPHNADLLRHLRNALSAKELYLHDREYVVKNMGEGKEIIIVDEFTGRLMLGRRYSEGLHQAIEAKEGVKVQQESKTLATITIQNYFRMYSKLAGMTGTAETEAEELAKIYKLEVVVIPTNKPLIREDLGDFIYKDEAAKFKALVREVEEIHKVGRPVLIGTTSIDKNKRLIVEMKKHGITHEVLNGDPKSQSSEAHIIANAGKIDAVTIATNTAGRGVDIILGGNPGNYDPLITYKEHKENAQKFLNNAREYVDRIAALIEDSIGKNRSLKRNLPNNGLTIGDIKIRGVENQLVKSLPVDFYKGSYPETEAKEVRKKYMEAFGEDFISFMQKAKEQFELILADRNALEPDLAIVATHIYKEIDIINSKRDKLEDTINSRDKLASEYFQNLKILGDYSRHDMLDKPEKTAFVTEICKKLGVANFKELRSLIIQLDKTIGVTEKIGSFGYISKILDLVKILDKPEQLEFSNYLSQKTELERLDESKINIQSKKDQLDKLIKDWPEFLSKQGDLFSQKYSSTIIKGEIEKEEQKREQDLSFWQVNHNKVVALGGLHVIGSERHEARRIDNQLRGRAGRQGDPGSSRFYVALDDDIMRKFGGERIQGIMNWAGMDENTPIENRLISRSIENAQMRVEGFHFDMRKHLVDYDDVINQQREVIYGERRKILSGADLRSNILHMVKQEIEEAVSEHFNTSPGEEPDHAALLSHISRIFPLPKDFTQETLSRMGKDDAADNLYRIAEALYAYKEKDVTPGGMRVLERLVMLKVIDSLWVEHLTGIDNLRQGIGMRAVAQQDPLVAYKHQASEMFQELMDTIREDVTHTIFKVNIIKQNAQRQEAPKPILSPMAKIMGTPGAGSKPALKPGQKAGRNDPCPCGSGKKYKHCCGK